MLLAVACGGDRPEAGAPATEEASMVESVPLEEQIDRFLASPSSEAGANLARAMGETGEVRYGPWLLDLYRLGRSSLIDEAAAASLADLSGVAPIGLRTDDYRNYGNWV